MKVKIEKQSRSYGAAETKFYIVLRSPVGTKCF